MQALSEASEQLLQFLELAAADEAGDGQDNPWLVSIARAYGRYSLLDCQLKWLQCSCLVSLLSCQPHSCTCRLVQVEMYMHPWLLPCGSDQGSVCVLTSLSAGSSWQDVVNDCW